MNPSYWTPSRATMGLGWGPEKDGDVRRAKLSMTDSPVSLLEGWEVLALLRAEGALATKVSLMQGPSSQGTDVEGPQAGTSLRLADGRIWCWTDLATALRRLIHVLPLFSSYHPGLMHLAARAFDHGVRHYEEYEFWHCGCCDELYNREWTSCPVCRRLSRQFFRRPT